MIWLKFILIQLVMLAATVAGWFILLPFCIAQAWRTEEEEFGTGRVIDRWTWGPLNYVYGNPEDGVSGQQAEVWNSEGQHVMYRSTFYPGTSEAWIAYCWSALRNSCDSLKYLFADANGPLVRFTWLGREGKIGWQLENGSRVPVLSL